MKALEKIFGSEKYLKDEIKSKMNDLQNSDNEEPKDESYSMTNKAYKALMGITSQIGGESSFNSPDTQGLLFGRPKEDDKIPDLDIEHKDFESDYEEKQEDSDKEKERSEEENDDSTETENSAEDTEENINPSNNRQKEIKKEKPSKKSNTTQGKSKDDVQYQNKTTNINLSSTNVAHPGRQDREVVDEIESFLERQKKLYGKKKVIQKARKAPVRISPEGEVVGYYGLEDEVLKTLRSQLERTPTVEKPGSQHVNASKVDRSQDMKLLLRKIDQIEGTMKGIEDFRVETNQRIDGLKEEIGEIRSKTEENAENLEELNDNIEQIKQRNKKQLNELDEDFKAELDKNRETLRQRIQTVEESLERDLDYKVSLLEEGEEELEDEIREIRRDMEKLSKLILDMEKDQKNLL